LCEVCLLSFVVLDRGTKEEFMSRKLADLQKECVQMGIVVPLPTRGRVTKSAYEVALRDFYWNRDHSGEIMLDQIEPQLAENIKDMSDEEKQGIYNSKLYFAQEKLDGCRFICHIKDGKVRFTSRRLSDKDYRFSEKTANFPFQMDVISKMLPNWNNTKLDGEMKFPVAVIDTGAVQTQGELQATVAVCNSGPDIALKIQIQYGPIIYHIFNVIESEGRCTMESSELHRYKVATQFIQELTQLVPDRSKSVLLVNAYDPEDGAKEKFYTAVVKAGGEGIMLKKKSAPYQPGKRTEDWLKVKRFEELDVFITGFLRGESGNGYENMVGALKVSAYGDDGKLYEIASVSNMDLEYRRSITEYDSVTNTVTLKQEVFNKVIVIRGMQFTKNLRLGIAKWVPAISWREPYRFDKSPDDCTFKSTLIKAKIEAGERI
jgi:ATP-dependent DNA ligase